MMVKMDTWMKAIIGSATDKGATKDEISILCEAARLIEKYKPTKEDLAKKDEFGKFIVNSKEKKIELT